MYGFSSRDERKYGTGSGVVWDEMEEDERTDKRREGRKMGINVERKTNKKQMKYVSEGHTTEEVETREKMKKKKNTKERK